MVKWSGWRGDTRILGLGLSRKNTELLLQGQPIVVRCADVGIDIPLDIVLVGGETEADIAAELKVIQLRQSVGKG